jgi:putative hydrolase of the HAD superfamily
MKRRVEGILFDLGDTLLDFGQVDILGLFEAGARLAYDYLRGIGKPLPPFAKYHRWQLWAIRWNYFKSRLTRREFNAMDLIGRLGDRMGHGLSQEQMVELAWLWYRPLSECATMEPGLRQLLEDLRRCGLKLGLVSNTFIPGQVLDRHLQRANLLDLLPVRVYSCDVAFRKPHAGIFTAALERAGLEAHRTMFVGDSPAADVAGARHAGMISVLKSRQAVPPSSKLQPDHHISRLAQLREVLEEYELPLPLGDSTQTP